MKLALSLRLLFRAWLYLRTGYGTYVTWPLAFISFVTTVYYLMISNIPGLKAFFSSFILFSVFVFVSLVPVCIMIGYAHYKRSRGYSSELDITIESNPYYWKVTPGKEKDIQVPNAILGFDASVISVDAAMLGVDASIVGMEMSLQQAKALGCLTEKIESEYGRLQEQYRRLRDQYSTLETRYIQARKPYENMLRYGDYRELRNLGMENEDTADQ